MKVFKFGGASVKDAGAVMNVADILGLHAGEDLVVVVSAMGKTTNALEGILNAWHDKAAGLDEKISELSGYHLDIIRNLFPDPKHIVHYKLLDFFNGLRETVSGAPSDDYDFDYDQVVCLGELVSTMIISEYLAMKGFSCGWYDVRSLVRTDRTWREGKVDWETTAWQARKTLDLDFSAYAGKGYIAVTQGFLGGTEDGFTTTLGREGSDYTAAIFSHILDAESMTVWKDVPGVLNADPKHFANTSLLTHISYREAIELTYYGASVIHPKTIKPLQNKGIPLRVRSFLHPEQPGTVVGHSPVDDDKQASVILKSRQVLMSFSPKDFSFIAEDNLSEIFAALAACGIRANVMQTSALSFSVCMDENERKMNKLAGLLDKKFDYRYNKELQLITIRHYDQSHISRLLEGRRLILEQRSRSTAQFVVAAE